MIGIGLVVGEHEATEAVLGQRPDDFADESAERPRRQRDCSAPADGQRADAVLNGWRQDGTIASAAQIRSDAPGDLLGAQLVDRQRQVRTVLLDGPERQQHDRPPIARQQTDLGVSVVD